MANDLQPATQARIDRLKVQATELQSKIPTKFFRRLLDNALMDLDHIPRTFKGKDDYVNVLLGFPESHIEQAQKAWDTYGDQLMVIPDE